MTRQLSAETVVLILATQDLTSRARQVEQQILYPAEVVRNAARSAFYKGATNIFQLVDAERAYTEAWREALDLKLEAHTKAFEARLAVGGEEKP